MKAIRMTLGALLVASGVIFALLPGSILVLIGGLVLLSYDWPKARRWLAHCQSSMSRGARKLDRYLLARKLR